MRSNGEWKANEGRSVIAIQDRTQTGTEKGLSNTKRVQNPKSREDILTTRDHLNVEPGASSGVNKPRPMTSKTQEDASNGDKGPISRVTQLVPMEGQTEKDDGNGTEPVVDQPEPGEGYKQKDASNGDKGPISRVNQLGSTEGQTENDDGKVKGPVVNQPEPMEGQPEKDDDNGKGPVVNQPEPGEGQTDKDTGNREGSISGVNQLGSRTDYTQEYGDELEPEASSRATQPVEQSTVEGITNVSSSQGGTDKVLSRVDVDMSRTNSKADNAEERNIGEGGSDKYHSIETNKEAIVRGGTVREGTDNHTKASEPKNKDAAENKEAATGSSVHPLGPVEDSDYPSFDEDEDEDPDNIDNEYEDHKFAADDENDNRDFEISSDTKKVKQQDGVVKIPKQMDAFEEEESSGHFMAYFVTAVVLCIAGYVLYHNKQKIIAFVLEGRRDAQRRRTTSSGTAKYTKLQPSVEEVMPSLDKSAATKNFIY
ncbi:trans-Golgi network integral membrane protein 1-like isoform X2 [Pomacea canaliculata]|uniref:trans-Golgi network integral membrane protein 1-like isoform X2 n=1 Tax=Pomacea canaliculata TaxID=400727 RepID=UPI000D72F861|nr:trans-Golgi network integral membrane protein 1-like isoform X2 [Pomacea canaliculata]